MNIGISILSYYAILFTILFIKIIPDRIIGKWEYGEDDSWSASAGSSCNNTLRRKIGGEWKWCWWEDIVIGQLVAGIAMIPLAVGCIIEAG